MIGAVNIREDLKMVFTKDLDNTRGLMEIFIGVNTKVARGKVLVCLKLEELNIRVHGIME